MKFFKFLRFDLINGGKCALKPFGGGLLLLLFVIIDFFRRIWEYSSLLESPMDKFTIGDMSMYLFGGMKEYVPSPDEAFHFPALWLLLFVIALFSTLYYPSESLQGLGVQILINAGGRKGWWLSKVIWNISTVTAYFILAWLLMLTACLGAGGDFSFKISDFILEYYQVHIYESNPADWRLMLQLIIAPWLVAMAVSMLQMLISLVLQPVFSLIISVSILVSSAYFCHPALIGNYAMALRDIQILPQGMEFWHGFIYSLFILAVSIAAGTLYFKHYDILAKEA